MQKICHGGGRYSRTRGVPKPASAALSKPSNLLATSLLSNWHFIRCDPISKDNKNVPKLLQRRLARLSPQQAYSLINIGGLMLGLTTGTLYTGNATPSPLGPALQSSLPALKYVVRVREESESLTGYAQKALYQKSIYAEPDFFHIMTFPAIEGDPAATLREGSGVVLTLRAARRPRSHRRVC
jgi:hypothetical protein